MVRDYLYLAPNNITKCGYYDCIKLTSNVLTDVLYEGSSDNDEGSSNDNSSSQEFEITRDMKLLYSEYLWFVTLKLAYYLDDIIEPYTCPCNGDTYRSYRIDHEH